jgi:hypothetical protein
VCANEAQQTHAKVQRKGRYKCSALHAAHAPPSFGRQALWRTGTNKSIKFPALQIVKLKIKTITFTQYEKHNAQ